MEQFRSVSTSASDNIKLVCALLSGVAEANPQHADHIQKKIAEIQSHNVLPTQFVDIVRQINQTLIQDRNAWEVRLRLAGTEIESVRKFILSTPDLSSDFKKKTESLSSDSDPVSAIESFSSLLKHLATETASLRKKDTVIIDGSGKRKFDSASNVIANDISAAGKRMLTLSGPLINSLLKENPDNPDVRKLHSRYKSISESQVVDFFETVLLMEDTSKQISYSLSQKVSSESRFLSGIHDHLQNMHANLSAVLENSGILNSASGKEKDRLELMMNAFKHAAEGEDDPVKLKRLISDNIELMKNSVHTIIEKQSISNRQQERIIQRLMLDVSQQKKEIDTIQKAHKTLESAAQRAHEDSFKDQLTGAFNRRAYDNYSKKLEEHAKKKGAEIAMIVLDIDRFKSINDTHGHAVGDKVLRSVLHFFSETLRSTTISEKLGIDKIPDRCKIFRTGGEEFVITCAGMSLHHACIIAEHIRLAISQRPMIWKDALTQKDQTINVTASFGVSSFNSIENKSDDVFVMADKAMYQAKSEGRNQTWFHFGSEIKKF